LSIIIKLPGSAMTISCGSSSISILHFFSKYLVIYFVCCHNFYFLAECGLSYFIKFYFLPHLTYAFGLFQGISLLKKNVVICARPWFKTSF
jgi:hypothetical protein